MSEAVRAALAAIVDGGTLTREEARAAMGAVMDGESTPAQLAAMLVALRMRGETIDELTGFAEAMRSRAVRVDAPAGTIDVVGTGGDHSGTINVSTGAALIAAAAGIPVAKHGNRAITSKAGSADVLEALRIRTDHDAGSAATALRNHGFAFLFAPAFHPAMRHAGPTRRELGIRTAFNLLGPLTNPAGATRAVLGLGLASAAPTYAAVVAALGTERTFVVHGAGVDELPLDGSGVIHDVGPDGSIRRFEVDPASVGLPRADLAAIAGGTAPENAAVLEAVLAGTDRGPRRDVILLNAAAAFVVAGRAADLAEGVRAAAAVVDGGAATALLEQLRDEKCAADAARSEVLA